MIKFFCLRPQPVPFREASGAPLREGAARGRPEDKERKGVKIEDRRTAAQEVLKSFSRKLKKEDPGWIVIGCYQNGREQGYSINTLNNFFCFSEFRNSDDIVVYQSPHNPMQSITEEMYKDKHLFRSPEEAAEFIYSEIIKETKND